MSKMFIYEFGRKLIETKDLDPVYVMLWEAKLEPELLKRYLLSYWCFYHVGTSAWICDTTSEKEYWSRMGKAAASKEYSRSSERRHYRGQKAIDSVAWLREQSIEGLFSNFARAAYENRTLTVEEVMEYAVEWPQFGPWIAFKVADMLERLDLVKVKFDNGSMFLFDSPQKGAELLKSNYGDRISKDVEDWAVGKILQHLGEMKAPPRYERYINAQEAETILCKWHSYMKSGYHVGEDIESMKSSLLKSKCGLTEILYTAGKKGGLWE